MKKSLLFILILLSSKLLACGFYPSGEDLRFTFFNNRLFGYYAFDEFNYSANYFYPGIQYPADYVFPNEQLWFDYCKGKVPLNSISKVLNTLPASQITSQSQNSMIQYLFKMKDGEAINYLKFAKISEFGNSWEEDPWERNSSFVTVARSNQIKKAIRLAAITKTQSLKLRYLFLAMRLSYYNSDIKTINTLFEKNIKNSKQKDIIYYWSLYFQSLAEKDSALCNFYAAQVFANAPDKRFMIAQQFNSEIPIERVLAFAQNDKERANVYLLKGILSVDQSSEYLKKLYQLAPNSEGFSFLLLREVNKIEDWVFTPYYSLFEPATRRQSWQEDGNNSVTEILKRVAGDRQYAANVLAFINTVPVSKTDNPMLFTLSKMYLQFISQNYEGCLSSISNIEKNKCSVEVQKQIEIIKALALTANQEYGKAIILDEVKPIVLKNNAYQKFIFALGRELEYKGNTTDAALLYSLMNEVQWSEETDSYTNNAFWKSKKSQGDTYADFYDNYFDYMNVMYTPEQVQSLINNIIINRSSKDEFAIYKYKILKSEISRLHDLLGTKYIRQNRLQKAVHAFRKVNNKLWNDKYTSWERNKDNSWDYGNNVFDQNPFYVLKYTPEFIPVKDTIRLNKYTVTKQLIKYINRANNPLTKDRDYYYFLVANCYYNMTQNGNSWMMRRYYWSSIGGATFIEDEKEFHECNLAQHYYKLALSKAKTDKFKALCLRMIGKCESFRLRYSQPYDYNGDYEAYAHGISSKNKYYQDLKLKYPEYYKDVISDCSLFSEYFMARR
ncbi:hypothetical protein [Flavobacterium sp. 25HG05S-40]|uniref:hypothetical protein n=1 Tax=Flavobacterium sp. 25HG05S-40 TaxID=3458682 RepID=UPI004043E6C9